MKSSNKKRVLISVLHQGYVRPELFRLADWRNAYPSLHVDIAFPDKKPSETNRNGTALMALAGKYDFLISIDHDVVPTRNPLELVTLDLDVVAAAVPQMNFADPAFPIYLVAMDKSEHGYTEHKTKEGLQEVDAVGTGCIVVARRVLEKIPSPFVRRWDDDGIATLGLDLNFCERAKAEGFRVFCHYGHEADHFKGEVSLLSVYRAMLGLNV